MIMKKYVIFGWAAGIAGGQLHTAEKCKVVMKNGYAVYVVYAINKKIMLPSIIKANSICVPEINYMPSYYFSNNREKIVKKIISFINRNDSDEVFIESNDVRYSYWAELVASVIKCKHFMFCLEGYFDYSSHKNMDYLKFKLLRSEIAGTRESSLYQLFGKDLITKSNNRFFRAYIGPSFANVPGSQTFRWNSFDYVIGYIGRESKPCFKGIVDGVLSFGKKHSNLKILFLCIGCSEGCLYDKLRNESLQMNNFSICFTGKLYPIPLDYIKNLDVCLGSSGSAAVAARNGIRTIKYFDNSEEPLGVIGYDIRSFSEEKIYKGNLCELLEDVLFNGFCEKFTYKNLYIPYDMELDEKKMFNDCLEMMSPCELSYYDTSRITLVGCRGWLSFIYHRIKNWIKCR